MQAWIWMVVGIGGGMLLVSGGVLFIGWMTTPLMHELSGVLPPRASASPVGRGPALTYRCGCAVVYDQCEVTGRQAACPRHGVDEDAPRL